jgi:hypothetical protein
MSRSTKPIDPKTKERYAELIGIGLSHPEAARVTGISERSGERLMAKPEYRKIAEDATRGRRVQGLAATTCYDLLTAVHEDGTPNLLLRAEGVAMYLNDPSLNQGDVAPEETLPAGVRVVLPVPPSAREPDSAAERLFGFADVPEPE